MHLFGLSFDSSSRLVWIAAGSFTSRGPINAVQGYDVTATKLPAQIPAGGSATITVEWATTGFAPGTYYGVVPLGCRRGTGTASPLPTR